MQSPFSYTDSSSSYSSSPGGMDFFFYGSPQPIYEPALCDLDAAASPFAVSEVIPDAAYSFTSSPYMYSPMHDFPPVYEHPVSTSVPSSASSTCGSTCGSSSWNNTMAEEVPMPSYPLASDDSGPDSPSTQSK